MRMVRPVRERWLAETREVARHDLDGGPEHHWFREGASVYLVKVGWWEIEPNSLGPEFPGTREVKRGATVAIDASGKVHAVIRTGRVGSSQGRDLFLGRLAAAGALVTPEKALGPDGKPLRGLFTVDSTKGAMRLQGGFQALHVADVLP